MKYFTFFFGTKFLKSSVYFILMAQLNSEEPWINPMWLVAIMLDGTTLSYSEWTDRQTMTGEYQGHLNSRMLRHILNHGPLQFQKLVLSNTLVLRFYHLQQQLKSANYFNRSLSAPACIENWSWCQNWAFLH